MIFTCFFTTLVQNRDKNLRIREPGYFFMANSMVPIPDPGYMVKIWFRIDFWIL